MNTAIGAVPNDILKEIFLYLIQEELETIPSVCKLWNQVFTDPSFQTLLMHNKQPFSSGKCLYKVHSVSSQRAELEYRPRFKSSQSFSYTLTVVDRLINAAVTALYCRFTTIYLGYIDGTIEKYDLNQLERPILSLKHTGPVHALSLPPNQTLFSMHDGFHFPKCIPGSRNPTAFNTQLERQSSKFVVPCILI